MSAFTAATESLDVELGGMSPAEILSRGRAHHPFTDPQVRKALERVDKTGILDRLADWRAADRAALGLGGRPAIITDRALLVGLLLLAQEHSPLWMRSLSELLQYRLSPVAQDLLGIPQSRPAFADQRLERNRWEKNTNNAFHRMLGLMDPFPMSRRRARTYVEIQAILDAHDTERERVMKERLDEFTRRFLTMTFNEQPRQHRRASKRIDISFDQTFIKPPTRKGFSKKKLHNRVSEERKALKEGRALTPGPVDAFLGWYPKQGERPDVPRGTADTTSPEDAKDKGYSNLAWGWVANIAVRVDSERPDARRFPKLAVAATLSMPNVGVSEEAVSLMRASLSLDDELPAGVADADKAYFANALVERLHEPAVNLGFTPSTDYRVDRLGVRGGKGGAEYIEGGKYCPGMPQALKDATKDYAQATIDEATFRVRVKERKAFALHAKEKPDAKGRVPMACPALGPSPTVTCPIRELARNAAKKERPSVAEDDVPDFLDRICRQHSVTFTPEDNLDQNQAFPYMSEEWEEFHQHARNSIESLNAGIKDLGRESIEESSRRRVRGFAAAQVFVTVLLTNYNLRKIAAFISEELEKAAAAAKGVPPKQPIRRRRDREWYNPYTKTTPRGMKPPLKRELELAGAPSRT